MSTVVLIIGILWAAQVVFLEDFYLKTKKDEILQSTKDIAFSINTKGLEQSANTLLEIGLRNTVCIDVSDINGQQIVGYEGLGENCFLHMNRHNKSVILAGAIKSSGVYVVTDIKHPKFDTRFYNCAVINTTKDGTQYAIMVTATLAPVKEATGVIKTQLIYLSIALMIFATIVAFLISRSLTRPIRKLSRAATEIAHGNLNVDVEVKSNDELGKLSQNFAYMQKELAKVSILQKELVANISHDMRTPLTMIRGYAEAIKDITGDDKQVREHQLDIIVDEANRLNTLVNDVMDLSLIQAGQTKMNFKTFDIKQTVSAILERFELLEQTRGFEFIFNSPEKMLVFGDEARVEQVIYNLLINAVNHIGTQKHITVTIFEKENRCRLEIADTGEGIAQEDLPLIWDRYYKPYKRVEGKAMGTGLGLSIVKAILISHNSSFGVYSTLGVGSTFWFTLEKGQENLEK